MEDRLALLEERLAALSASILAFEARLSALEERGTAVVDAGPPPPHAAEDAALLASASDQVDDALAAIVPGREVVQAVPALVGRSCLVLGGAYLVRAVTESGAVPSSIGVMLGLAYAVAWAALADRAAARGRRLGAAFHGVTAAVIGFPLLWETSFHLKLLPTGAAGLTTLLFAGILIGVGWRRELAALAWAGTLGATAVLAALGPATGAVDQSSGLLLLLGIFLLWRTYGERWHGLRWPPALAADFSVLLMVVVTTRAGGPPEAYAGVSRFGAFLVAFLLPLAYVGSISVRTIVRQRDVNVFEVLQGLLSIAVGFGGAVALASGSTSGETALGVSALLLGAASYAVAFVFVERKSEAPRNFLFYTSLALLLLLAGGPLALSWILAWVFGAAGAVCAVLGAKPGKRILAIHSAVYLVAASGFAGLLSGARAAFVGTVDLATAPPHAAAGVVLLLTVVSAAFLLRSPAGSPSRLQSVPAIFVTLLALAGLAPFAVWMAGAAVRAAGRLDGAALSSVRTGFLAVAAVALALLSRRTGRPAFAWTSYAVLAAGGLKLVLVDVGSGRPATLLFSFGLYGLALVIAPRFLHAGRADSR